MQKRTYRMYEIRAGGRDAPMSMATSSELTMSAAMSGEQSAISAGSGGALAANFQTI